MQVSQGTVKQRRTKGQELDSGFSCFKMRFKNWEIRKKKSQTRSRRIEREAGNQDNLSWKSVMERPEILVMSRLQWRQFIQDIWVSARPPQCLSLPPPCDNECNLLSGLNPAFKVLDLFRVEIKDYTYVFKSGLPWMAVDSYTRINIEH